MDSQPLLLLVVLAAASVGAATLAPQPAGAPAATAPPWPLLQSLTGKVVLVDFWASWCAPCLQSFPWMNDLQQASDEGLVIVAVNLDQDRALADAFLKKVPAEFRVEYDAEGGSPAKFGVEAMPTSFLIGRDGQVHARQRGLSRETARGPRAGNGGAPEGARPMKRRLNRHPPPSPRPPRRLRRRGALGARRARARGHAAERA